MSLNILYRGPAERGQCWQNLFSESLPEIMVCWIPPNFYQNEYPNLKVIFSVGAGVDQLDLASIPSHVTVVRMLDPGISQGMSEFVTLSVLNIHRDVLAFIQMNQQAFWKPLPITSAAKRTVGIMGLGHLGQHAAKQLNQFGFKVTGWSNSPKTLPNIVCYSGTQNLSAFLKHTDILVCLLPLTDNTRGILNHQTLSLLPKGASLINVGRGEHLVEQDLLSLLDEQHLRYAILDVFTEEPLPHESPLWHHPQVLVTPHIAAATQNESAGEVLVNNVQRYLDQQPMLGEVDRTLGY
jgi:glyoxylate/hydroxypyruvate reductase